MIESTVSEFEKYSNRDDYEVFDEVSQTWKSYSTSCYIERVGGFPDIKKANERIQLITVKRRDKKAVTFGWKPVEGKPLNTEYRLSLDEESMLRAYVMY